MPSVDVQVAAAVIERGGLILIGQRKRGSKHSLKWEFPGGKLEAGETPQAALARELREELGIQAEIGEQLDSYDVQYPGGGVTRLFFFHVTTFTGEPRNLDFEQIAWERRDRLSTYDFLEGDVAFVERFANRRATPRHTPPPTPEPS
jgi:8-oxo-dGTP diphosphatase